MGQPSAWTAWEVQGGRLSPGIQLVANQGVWTYIDNLLPSRGMLLRPEAGAPGPGKARECGQL